MLLVFYVEAEETETWVKQGVKAGLKRPEGLTSHETHLFHLTNEPS